MMMKMTKEKIAIARNITGGLLKRSIDSIYAPIRTARKSTVVRVRSTCTSRSSTTEETRRIERS